MTSTDDLVDLHPRPIDSIGTDAARQARRTASYVTTTSAPIVRPAQCRCADPQAVIVSTGPVLCSSCGRRIG